MNCKQKRCIEILDDLVESGVDITRLGKELPKDEYHRVRKRIYLAFGTGKKALEAFGLYDVNTSPADYELFRCFYIDDNYEVMLNTYEKDILCDIYNIDDAGFRRVTSPIVMELRWDALDEFYRNEFPVK